MLYEGYKSWRPPKCGRNHHGCPSNPKMVNTLDTYRRTAGYLEYNVTLIRCTEPRWPEECNCRHPAYIPGNSCVILQCQFETDTDIPYPIEFSCAHCYDDRGFPESYYLDAEARIANHIRRYCRYDVYMFEADGLYEHVIRKLRSFNAGERHYAFNQMNIVISINERSSDEGSD